MVIVMVRDVSDTYDLQNNREIELENNQRAKIIYNDLNWLYQKQMDALDDLPENLDRSSDQSEVDQKVIRYKILKEMRDVAHDQ